MIIGKWTIRKTSDIKAEQVKRDKAKAVSAKLVEFLLHNNKCYKAILRRWGLSEGLIEQEATYSQGEALSPPRRRH